MRRVANRRKKYRHIEVTDNIDRINKFRTVTVRCPLEYPGLTDKEKQRMQEGLTMIADAFKAADARCSIRYNGRR